MDNTNITDSMNIKLAAIIMRASWLHEASYDKEKVAAVEIASKVRAQENPDNIMAGFVDYEKFTQESWKSAVRARLKKKVNLQWLG